MSISELTGLASQTLGHYQLVRETGRGGMSIVYEAVDTRLGRTVALKVLRTPPSSQAGEEELVARMEREARAVASLSHPNVVTIYDIGEQGGIHYIATEFLDGMTLREQLHQGPVMLHQAADILRQVADGLDAVHRQGIMHRDIKPSNIMMLYNGRVKLLDFGIARFTHDSTLTQIGSMVGSPSYMAPELLMGEKAAPASDIWSLGVVLFEMLSCRLPFEADSMAGIMYHVMYDSPALLPNACPEIADVLYRALNKSPSERFPTACALADAFDEALAAQPAFKSGIEAPMKTGAVLFPTVQEEKSSSRAEDNTHLASMPIITEPRRQPNAVDKKPYALLRRTRLLPAVLAFAAVCIGAVATFLWLGISSKNASRKVPPLASKSNAEDTKRTNASPRSVSVPAVKVTAPSTVVRIDSPSPTARRRTMTQNHSVRKTVPKVTTSQTPSAEKAVKKDGRRGLQSVKATEQVKKRLEAVAEHGSELQNHVNNAALRTEENSEIQTELRDSLNGWIAATNARDIGRQMRYYSSSLSAFYLKRDVATQAVRAEKARLFARASDVNIQGGQPQIKLSSDGSTATMRFRKQYHITNGTQTKRGAVLQELRWQRSDDNWRIVSERDLRVLKN